MRINNDKHLNIFWQYDGCNDSKDNIKRAIINFLQYSETNNALEVLSELMNHGEIFKGIELDTSKVTNIKYSLKQGFTEEEILEFPNRVVLAINPSGNTWNGAIYEEFDMQYDNYLNDLVMLNDERLKQRIVEQFEYSSNKEYVASNVKLIKEIIERCIKERDCKLEPAPTAWIAIYQEQYPICLIALENKLHDVDPFQLNNYLRDTLKVDEMHYDQCKIVCSYEDLYKILLNAKESFVRDNLLEYLYLLGYEPVNNFLEEEFSLAINDGDITIIKKKWDKILQSYFSTIPEHSDKLDYILSTNKIQFNDISSGEISFKVENVSGEPMLCISSEIGVDEIWKNTKIATFIKDNPNVVEMFKSIYSIDTTYKNNYELWWRINTENVSFYEQIESYENVSDLLNDFKDEVYDSIILRNDLLIKICDKKKVDLNSEEIKNWQFNTWKYNSFNRLSYIKINTYIGKENLIEEHEGKTLDEIYSMLDRVFDIHSEGLCYINSLLFEEI